MNMNSFEKNIMHVGEMASGAKLTVPVYTFKNEDVNLNDPADNIL